MIEVLIVASNYGVVHVTYLLVYKETAPEYRPHRRVARLARVWLTQVPFMTRYLAWCLLTYARNRAVHIGCAVRWNVTSRLPGKRVATMSDREKVSVDA